MRNVMISVLIVLCVSAVAIADDFRLYAGGILADEEVNGIFDLLHTNTGVSFIVQDDNTVWDDEKNDFRASFHSHNLFEDLGLRPVISRASLTMRPSILRSELIR